MLGRIPTILAVVLFARAASIIESRAVPLSQKAMSKSTEEFRKRAVRTSCKEVSTWSISEKISMRSTSQVQWDDPSSADWDCCRYPSHLQESQFQIEAGLVDVGPWESRRVVKHDQRDNNKAQRWVTPLQWQVRRGTGSLAHTICAAQISRLRARHLFCRRKESLHSHWPFHLAFKAGAGCVAWV